MVNQDKWPPMKGTYTPQKPEDKPLMCRHRGRPSESWGKPGEYGIVHRVTPGHRQIPAQALIEWDGYTTWERLADLLPA